MIICIRVRTSDLTLGEASRHIKGQYTDNFTYSFRKGYIFPFTELIRNPDYLIVGVL